MVEDLVVVVPGIMGSSLADSDGHEVWGLGAGSLTRALASFGASVRRLVLPAGLGDAPAPDGILATGLLPGLHVIPGVWTPIQGYDTLVRFLLKPRFALALDRPGVPGGPAGNLVVFAYDWRLSNRRTSELLKTRVETALTRWRESSPARADARVVFICHSMGGLVARRYIELQGGAEITRALATLGTPHRGAAKGLEELVNGVRKGAGPLKVDLSVFARSLPAAYQLLPEYACLDDGSGSLLKTTETTLPRLDADMVADGMRFHDELDTAHAQSYTLVPVVGIGQPTRTTARLVDERIESLDTIDGRDLAGDGTVPRLSARPKRLNELDPSLRGVVEGHGSLCAHRSVLDQLDYLLTAEDIVYRAADGEPTEPENALGLSVPELYQAGETVRASVHFARPRVLQAVAIDDRGRESASGLVRFGDEQDTLGRAIGTASLERLSPGGYTVMVRAPDDPGGVDIRPVHTTTFVWEA